MLLADQPILAYTNHPLAARMAAIAFINQNITNAVVWGSFSVLLSAVEMRLGVGRELSTLAVPAINLIAAFAAPVIGTLVTRHSLRLLMLAGSIFSVAGFALLALTTSYPLYLLAYGLLLGPGVAIGAILPSALVTRWYRVNRGRALGIVNTTIVIVFVPLMANWALQSYGVSATYMMLSGLSLLSVIANFFIVDHPPESSGSASHARTHAAGGPSASDGMTMVQLLRSPRFWVLALAFSSCGATSMIAASHLVPMARSWGLSITLAATLLSIQSFAGIVGAMIFGRVADCLGGALALAIMLLDSALLWAILLLHPPFPILVVTMALLGAHAAATIPLFGVALSESFGQENFGRAFGLAILFNLPCVMFLVPGASLVFARTGSYDDAIMGIVAFLGLAGLLVLSRRRRQAQMAESLDFELPPN